MGKKRKRSQKQQNPWCEQTWDGDAVDRFYAQELRADAGGTDPVRTIPEAEEAWGIFHLPWWTKDDVRAINDALAPYWLPYIYSHEIHASTLRELGDVVDRCSPTRVLDVGCGVGFDACFLATRGTHLVVRGTDLSPKMIARSQARAERLRLNHVQFAVAAHHQLPRMFPDQSFDFIYAHGSLIYRGMRDLRACLKGIVSVLRLGGIFFCEMPMQVDPSEFIYIVQGLELGLTLWCQPGAEIRTLKVDGREICWCCGFRKDG